MRAIVLVDQNWGIGKDGKQNMYIKGDMKRFRELTLNTTIVTGRKTFETFHDGKPLSNRNNVLLTTDTAMKIDGVTIVHSITELMSLVNGNPDMEVFVVGGSSVYTQLLPYCDTVYVTKVFKECENDRFFPNLDQSLDWRVQYKGGVTPSDTFAFTYLTYTRTSQRVNYEESPLLKMYQWVMHNIHLMMYGDEDKVGFFIAELGALCLEYGTSVIDTESRQHHFCIEEADKCWIEMRAFINFKYSIEIDGDGFFMLCKGMLDGIDDMDDVAKFIKIGIDSAIANRSKTKDIPASIFTIPPNVDITPSNNFLFREYFSLLQQLGTFYNDPDQYESDAKRVMHGRIMEIYNLLSIDSPK